MPTKIPDRATEYARDVVARRTVAGPYVRASCKRHLSDLASFKRRGLIWDVEASDRIIRFFENVLTVEIEDEGGDSSVAPFKVEPWQAFVLGALFGWKLTNGLRRFRRAYIEIGKGNGKSPMAAGIGHYMLTAMKKIRAEVYSAATDKDQAAILFRDAVSMANRSPSLDSRLVQSGNNPVWQLTDLSTESFFKPISSEKKGKSGIRPFCALIDEVHEHPNNSVIEMLRAGTKGNQQALIFEITNSGFDRQSVCWNEHQYTIKVVSGEIENDSWFGYICSLDDGDDPFEDEACWMKANPNLGVSIRKPYIVEQMDEARGMPSKESIVRRLHFCQWTDASDPWLERQMWEAVEAELDIKDYADKKCWLAIDMSFTKDLTALGIVFESLDPEKKLDLFVEFWTPNDTMKERSMHDQAPYPVWSEQGFLNASPGKVIKLPQIAGRIAELDGFCDIKSFAYDQYRHREMADELYDIGLDLSMVEHPQGFRRTSSLRDKEGEILKDLDGRPVDNPLWMPSSFSAFETLIIEEEIRVAINPVMRWNVASAVIRDDPAGTGNRIFDKRKATGRIDGVVAAAMAVGLAVADPDLEEGPSIYESEHAFI